MKLLSLSGLLLVQSVLAISCNPDTIRRLLDVEDAGPPLSGDTFPTPSIATRDALFGDKWPEVAPRQGDFAYVFAYPVLATSPKPLSWGTKVRVESINETATGAAVTIEWNGSKYSRILEQPWELLRVKPAPDSGEIQLFAASVSSIETCAHAIFLLQLGEAISLLKPAQAESALEAWFTRCESIEPQTFRLGLALAERNVRPSAGSLVWIQEPQGLRFSKHIPKANGSLRDSRPLPMRERVAKNLPSIRFKGYSQFGGYLFASVVLGDGDSGWLRLNTADSLLRQAPDEVDYAALVERIGRSDTITCDLAMDMIRYLNRWVSVQLRTGNESMLLHARSKDLAAVVARSARHCSGGKFGPDKDFDFKMPRLPSQMPSNSHVFQKCRGPTPLSKVAPTAYDFAFACYRNPALSRPWCKYNHDRKLGAELVPGQPDECMVLARHKVVAPTLQNLLSEVDFATLSKGYFQYETIGEPVPSFSAVVVSPQEMSKAIIRNEREGHDVLTGQANASYAEVATTLADIWGKGKWPRSQHRVIAKRLREFSLHINGQLSAPSSGLVYIEKGDEIDDRPARLRTIFVPHRLEQLGLSFRPLNVKFRYTARVRKLDAN